MLVYNVMSQEYCLILVCFSSVIKMSCSRLNDISVEKILINNSFKGIFDRVGLVLESLEEAAAQGEIGPRVFLKAKQKNKIKLLLIIEVKRFLLCERFHLQQKKPLITSHKLPISELLFQSI